MPGFRVQHPMKQLSIDDNTCTYTCANRNIHTVFKTAARPPGCFPQGRTINIRIKSHRDIQRPQVGGGLLGGL